MSDAEQIATNASQPKSIKTDGLEVVEHGVPDQIAADQHEQNQKATKSPTLGLRFAKMIPPGCG
jgi:hypothetical protein